jgi:ABC-type polysaccharide/polyol phosphate transport system ATPase subunit
MGIWPSLGLRIMEPSIQFLNVSKRYRIGQSVPTLRSIFRREKLSDEQQFHWAVKELDFQLYPGQSLGIIGPNGAGKTTTLKLLSQVTFPTDGEIKVNGRLSALIELGAGFHPELTGRENIFLNGTILGMSRNEIKERFDDIVEFAEIGKFLDTPVKRYSSGMYARLGFAVAAHVAPEILVVDEVLAVGDMAFQRKCYDRMKQLISQGTTMIFVSHNMQAVQEVCDRCLVMYRGHKAFDGSPAEATAEFSNILRRAAKERAHLAVASHGMSQQVMTHEVVIENVSLVGADETPGLTFESGEVVEVRAQLHVHELAERPVLACRIIQPSGQVVYDYTTEWANCPAPDLTKDSVVEVVFRLELNLAAGTYYLGVNIATRDLTRYYDRIDRALDFVVTGGDGARGIANLNATYTLTEVESVTVTAVAS